MNVIIDRLDVSDTNCIEACARTWMLKPNVRRARCGTNQGARRSWLKQAIRPVCGAGLVGEDVACW